jgi:hypothetical protein
LSLTQTLAQLRTNVRRMADVAGGTATQRHPDADLNDYVNRGIAALRRELDVAIPDQRFLTSSTVSTVAGTSTYALPAAFNHLVSVDLTAYGTKVWLVAYEMHERATLTTPDTTYSGVPHAYRLQGSNIELLPVPQGVFTLTLWYTADPSTLSSDAATFDTITRLDDYVIAYAAKLVAMKDKNWDLVQACDGMMTALREDVQFIARSRDRNSPSRPVDEMLADRWGRSRRW